MARALAYALARVMATALAMADTLLRWGQFLKMKKGKKGREGKGRRRKEEGRGGDEIPHTLTYYCNATH